MARKLNKKVALLGSLVFFMLVLGAIGAVLMMSQDPQEFIKDGDTAYQNGDLKDAEEFYKKAYGHAKTDELKVDILFKLQEIFKENEEWHRVLKSWENIAKIEPENLKARVSRLKYFYILADTGAFNWQNIKEDVTEFFEKVSSAKLQLPKEEYDLLSFDDEVNTESTEEYLHFLRARANYEIGKRGSVTDPAKTLESAIEEFHKVLELNKDNVDAYAYLAEAERVKGQLAASAGEPDAEDKALDSAVSILENAVKIAGDLPETHLHLLKAKRSQGEEDIDKYEQKYIELTKRFPSSPEVYRELAFFYISDIKRLTNNINKAVEAMEKAYQLDEQNVQLAIETANLYYKKYSNTGNAPDLDRAVEIAESALKAKGAQDVAGPKQYENKNNRVALYIFLAKAHTSELIENEITEDAEKTHLAKAEEAVHQIEQLFGSGEDLRVIKWRGMLELAKGNRTKAVKRLYEVYRKQKGADQIDPMVAFALADIYKNSPEKGIRVEFLGNALKSGVAVNRPEAILDYSRELLALKAWNNVLSNLNAYEDAFGANQQTSELKALAYMGAKQFEQAEEYIAKLNPDSKAAVEANLQLLYHKIEYTQNLIYQKNRQDLENETSSGDDTENYLNQELTTYRNALSELLFEVSDRDDIGLNADFAIFAIQKFLASDELDKAKKLVSNLLENNENNVSLLTYETILEQPDPKTVTQEKRNELQLQAIKKIPDKNQQNFAMATYYQNQNDIEKALSYFKMIVDPETFKGSELDQMQRVSLNMMFNIALNDEKLKLAPEIIQIGKKVDLDGCGGRFMEARLLTAQQKYEKALAAVQECLDKNPLLSTAILLKGRINFELGNTDTALVDIKRAVDLNPLNKDIAKEYAIYIYRRNQMSDSSLTTNQKLQFREALLRAMSLNPQDQDLVSLYSENIKEQSPMEALAIRQNLLNNSPTVQNAVSLGNMALQLWQDETDPEKKEGLLELARTGFDKAMQIAPDDPAVIGSTAEFYDQIGEQEQAQKILEDANDPELMWQYHYRSGRYDLAWDILLDLHSRTPDNIEIIKGLFMTADKMKHAENIKKFSNELIQREDTLPNRLLQIQSYLNAGLINEAEQLIGEAKTKEDYSDDIKLVMLDGWLCLKNGKLQKAKEHANKALEINQDNPQAWRLRAEVKMYEGNYDQAIIDFRQSRVLADDYNTRIGLAKAYFKADRVGDAITELKSIAFEPASPVEARLMLEEALMKENDENELDRFYAHMLEKMGGNIVWINKAAAFKMRQEDYEQSTSLFKSALDLAEEMDVVSPASFDGYLESLIKAGNYDKALQFSSSYIDSPIKVIAFEKIAKIKSKLGNDSESYETYKKALDAVGDDIGNYVKVIVSMRDTLGYEKAWQHCMALLDAQPQAIQPNLAAYQLSYDKKQFNNAVDYIDICLKAADGQKNLMVNFMVKKALALQAAYNKTSDDDYMQRTIAQYEKIMQILPNNSGMLNNLAYMLAKSGQRLKDALEYAEKAYRMNPNDPSYLDTYAFVLYKNGDYEKASKYISSSIQQYERNNLKAPQEVYEHQDMIKKKITQ